jgi:FMN phosphatase YigB (HAD superfamily)
VTYDAVVFDLLTGVLEALGTSPARTLFVAGSVSDVSRAKAVGMPVYWHNRIGLPPSDETRPYFPEPTLDRPGDLFPSS